MTTTNIQYAAGYKAAQQGGWCAAPNSLPILSDEWRAWYEGFHAAKAEGKHPGLTRNGSIRPGLKVSGRAL